MAWVEAPLTIPANRSNKCGLKSPSSNWSDSNERTFSKRSSSHSSAAGDGLLAVVVEMELSFRQ
jgi:hypothetical protein